MSLQEFVNLATFSFDLVVHDVYNTLAGVDRHRLVGVVDERLVPDRQRIGIGDGEGSTVGGFRLAVSVFDGVEDAPCHLRRVPIAGGDWFGPFQGLVAQFICHIVGKQGGLPLRSRLGRGRWRAAQPWTVGRT